MVQSDIITWMLVFVRVSAMLAVFPLFSTPNFPVRVRVGLGALAAFLLIPAVPAPAVTGSSLFETVGVITMEAGVGLLLGFASRMAFYAVDLAGSLMAQEMGLSMAANFNPFSSDRSEAPGMVLYFMAVMMFLSLDLHHYLLAGFKRSYELLPIGGAHLSTALFWDLVARTSRIFVVAVQMAGPMIAVSFIITFIFAILGRSVPQMNVFTESLAFRTMAGLIVFGMTCHLMAQHILNYMRRLPEDVLRVAQLLGLT